jgi:hypothetical protein
MPDQLSVPRARIRASDLLMQTLKNWEEEHITLDQLADTLGERAFGVVMLLFALPNCIPAPPGMNSVFGIPLLLYAAQLMRGRGKPWQPQFIAKKKFKKETLIRLLEAAEPKLKKIEKLCRPRFLFMTSDVAERLTAFYIVLLSVCIIIPLWGTNFIPAFAAALLSIALIEQDGLLTIIGILIGLVGIGLTVGIVWGAVAAIKFAF